MLKPALKMSNCNTCAFISFAVFILPIDFSAFLYTKWVVFLLTALCTIPPNASIRSTNNASLNPVNTTNVPSNRAPWAPRVGSSASRGVSKTHCMSFFFLKSLNCSKPSKYDLARPSPTPSMLVNSSNVTSLSWCTFVILLRIFAPIPSSKHFEATIYSMHVISCLLV